MGVVMARAKGFLKSRSAVQHRVLLALAIVCAAMVALPGVVSALTVGPTMPGTGADVAGVGAVTWDNAGGITGDDTDYATALLNTTGGLTQSHYLRGTGYGFSLPSDAIVDGIAVTINRYASSKGAGGNVVDAVVSLVKGGAVTGSNLAKTGDWETTVGGVVKTYGGVTELWGTTWTAADINSPGFGVVLSALTAKAHDTTAYVDYMSITVTYHTSPVTSPAGAGADVTGVGTIAW